MSESIQFPTLEFSDGITFGTKQDMDNKEHSCKKTLASTQDDASSQANAFMFGLLFSTEYMQEKQSVLL